MSEASQRPVSFELDRRHGLRVRWADGHFSEYSLVELRRACPCATCREAREERSRNPLRVIQAPADAAAVVTVESAELVGHYAIRLRWKDGHDTGIYDYAALRAMCACAACCAARGPKS